MSDSAGTEPESPTLKADSLPTEPTGKIDFFLLKYSQTHLVDSVYICFQKYTSRTEDLNIGALTPAQSKIQNLCATYYLCCKNKGTDR